MKTLEKIVLAIATAAMIGCGAPSGAPVLPDESQPTFSEGFSQTLASAEVYEGYGAMEFGWVIPAEPIVAAPGETVELELPQLAVPATMIGGMGTVGSIRTLGFAITDQVPSAPLGSWSATDHAWMAPQVAEPTIFAVSYVILLGVGEDIYLFRMEKQITVQP